MSSPFRRLVDSINIAYSKRCKYLRHYYSYEDATVQCERCKMNIYDIIDKKQYLNSQRPPRKVSSC